MQLHKMMGVTKVTRIDNFTQKKSNDLQCWKDIIQALLDGLEVEIYYHGIGWQPVKRIPSVDVDTLECESSLKYRKKVKVYE